MKTKKCQFQSHDLLYIQNIFIHNLFLCLDLQTIHVSSGLKLQIPSSTTGHPPVELIQHG